MIPPNSLSHDLYTSTTNLLLLKIDRKFSNIFRLFSIIFKYFFTVDDKRYCEAKCTLLKRELAPKNALMISHHAILKNVNKESDQLTG